MTKLSPLLKKKSSLAAILILVLLLAGGSVLLLSGGSSSASSDASIADAEMGTPTPTKRPTSTPTETPSPTPTPPAAERVAKCKDADDATGSMRLIANWKVGDSRTINVTRWRQRIVRRKAKVVVQASVTYQINVLEASPEGYTLEWVVGDSNVQKGTETRDLSVDDLFLQDMLTLKPGLRVIYTTDANGKFLQIQNWSQVQLFHQQVRDLFNLRMEQMYKSKKTRDQIMAIIEPVWTDLSQIDQLYTQELRTYHAAFGRYIEPGQALSGKDLLPNLLGNMPLEAETVLRLSTFNPVNKCAFLDLNRRLTPSAIQQFLKDYLTRQAQITPRVVSGGNDLAATRVEDAIRYSVDMNGNWLMGAQQQRIIMIENLSMVDGMFITDITEKAAQ